MFDSSIHPSPEHAEGEARLYAMVHRGDVSAFMAFITERYPLLREALDRVAEELVKEGVDMQRLRDGDLSAISRSTSVEDHGDSSGT